VGSVGLSTAGQGRGKSNVWTRAAGLRKPDIISVKLQPPCSQLGQLPTMGMAFFVYLRGSLRTFPQLALARAFNYTRPAIRTGGPPACYVQQLAFLKIARNYMKATSYFLVLHRELRNRSARAQHSKASTLLQENIQKSNPVMRATHQYTCWDAVHVSNGHPCRPPCPARPSSAICQISPTIPPPASLNIQNKNQIGRLNHMHTIVCRRAYQHMVLCT
jgi:hypothetical protein